MSDTTIYPIGSQLKFQADRVTIDANANGLEPDAVAAAIVKAQLPTYERQTDPSVSYKDRSLEDKGDYITNRKMLSEGIAAKRYQFVVENGNQDMLIADPALVKRVGTDIAERNAASGRNDTKPTIMVDREQTIPYRYDRPTDTVFASPNQTGGAIDDKALNAALDVRADRSPATLAAELQPKALAYANETSSPAYERAATRAQKQAEAEGWDKDKPRVAKAMADAAYPEYRDATDPANPAATKPARDAFLASKGVNEITAVDNPALIAMVTRGTDVLNAEHPGQKYAPPTAVAVDGLSKKAGTVARFDPETDTVQIDSGYLASNPKGLEGVVGHELGHRYQRDPQTLKDNLQITYELNIGGKPTDAQYAKVRADETGADREGALIAGPQGMKDGLKSGLEWRGDEPPVTGGVTGKTNKQGVDLTHPTLEQRNSDLDKLASNGAAPKPTPATKTDHSISDIEASGPAPTPRSSAGGRAQVAHR